MPRRRLGLTGARGLIARLGEMARAARAAASPRRAGVVRLDDVRRRLELLITAVYDRPMPIGAASPPKRRVVEMLRRGLTRSRQAAALPSTDGHRIQLPREIESDSAEAALSMYRLMALEQAERIARGTPALLPSAATPMERDLYLVRESIAVDAAIARAVPGLRTALVGARTLALARRPPLARLTNAERAVERMLRRWLALDPSTEPAGLPGSRTPAASLAWARQAAAQLQGMGKRYRGIPPVAPWGAVHPAAGPPDNASPPREADDLATAKGSKYGVGRFGRGSGDGGRQASEDGSGEGTTNRPRRDSARTGAGGSAEATGTGPRSEPGDTASSHEPSLQDHESPRDALAEPLDASDHRAPGTGPARPDASASGCQSVAPRAHARSRVPAPRPLAHGVEYPEWDGEAGHYRPSGVVVRAHQPELGDDRWGDAVLAHYGPIVRRLRERFERLRARRARLGQQRDGDELDVAACVRALVDQRTGHAADDRLYVDVRPARRGLAIALLIDISGSTDEWIDARRRIIDVEKVALFLASEALDALGDAYAALTFSGKGRDNVRVRTIKGFDEANGSTVRRRIAALEPEGYTRSGAAVRHAAALLERQPAAHRLLLIISDGKPNDVDGYEGPHGVEDTRQAIIEARARGIYPFCLTVDRQGQEYLGRIFGDAGHTVLRNPSQLPVALVKVVRHLLAS